MTNRKSPTSFPVSRRWTAYVAPKPPSSVTVHFIRQMACTSHTCGRTHTPQLHACFQTVWHTMAMLDAHSLSADQLVFSFLRPNSVVLSLGVHPNECVKDMSQAVESATAFQVTNLAFYIHSTDGAAVLSHSCSIGFHIGMPFAPCNRAMLDARLLCG